MEKEYHFRYGGSIIFSILHSKILKIMKWTCLLLFLSVSLVFASQSYAQKTVISLNMTNRTVADVLNQIEEQTDFQFYYNSKLIDTNRKVSVTVKDSDVFTILKQIFENTDVSYKVMDTDVILTVESVAETLQDKRLITGIVKDQNGEPIIGANVVEKGTTNGTVTDIDGKFSINVASDATLSISYIGYRAVEIVVKNQDSYDIVLHEDSEALDEVIVIGYGTTKRKDFTGSVSSVKMENSPIALAANMNALEALKGNVTGLDIGATNTAGGTPSMQIRGQNSISGSNDPLVVVDGVIFMGSLNDINPNDIATYDVLKDATSAAAYGSRSANGVIMITTKKGKQGKPVINFNVSGSMQTWQRKPDIMNGEEWLDAVSARNSYTDYSFLTAQERENYEAGHSTDWVDEATRTGWLQDYQVSVSGAGEKMNYYLSTSYSSNKGVVIGDDYDRMTVLGKVSTDITDWLQIGVDAAYTWSDYPSISADLSGAMILSPYGMKYRGGSETLLEKYPNGQNHNGNPLWGNQSGTQDKLDRSNNFRTNAFAVVKLPWVEGLSYRLNYSGNMTYREQGSFSHEGDYIQLGAYDDLTRYEASTIKNYLASANGSLTDSKTTSWVLDNILNYNRTFGKHTIDVTAVATRDSKRYESKQMTGSDFSANGNTVLGYGGLSYAKIQKVILNQDLRTNIGYLGRLSYSFDDKYYLTGSYRRDGASVFGTGRKWGNFFAFGSAWRITEENFIKDVDFLDDLKLKLSWGRNGNQGLDPYATLSKVVTGTTGGIYYGFGNTGDPSYGINQSSIGNAELGWETTDSWNAGFESSWLNHRLFANLDFYFSKTTDQIFNRSIPVMTGFTSMYSSMGEVQNRGLELTVRSVNIQNEDWNWETSVTFWLNRNKLKHLYGEDLDGDGKEDDDIGNSLFIGYSIHAIYGYKQDGIVQTDDTEYMAANGVQPGTPKYVDMNGDGVINVDDRSILGSTDPNFKLNMSNTLTYKNWQLYFLITGTFGGNGYFQQSNKSVFMTSGGSNQFAANGIYVPYWTEENRSNKYPGPTYVGDDYFLGLQSRAYVRLQDITLSYTFDQPWVKNVGIQNLKVFFTGKNVATITGWTGGDPEMGTTVGSNPVLSSFSLGANISF